MTAIIEVEGLTKSYGSKRGITKVSFHVEEGEVFGFLGPNGAGKTTTIRLLMALLHADAGSARISGLDSWEQSVEIKRLIGYLPGEPALDPNLTGGQILEYFGHLRGGVDQTYLKQLINGLDPLNQQEFDRMVKEVRDEGRTVFLSSHILSEVEQTCTRVGIIREGQLVRVGGVAELKDIKRHEITITFADAVPAEAFETLDGVAQVETLPGGYTLRLAMQGEADAVIKAASHYAVVSLTSHEPSLEDIFLRYYEGDGSTSKEASHAV